ncbi:hypothetical protein DFH08DRAFT_1077351 [Mycena albidolilacea]|uniref:Uncharacterized protein n=1 Tax=Mycena albidolilacea TaxID=1033008 RepID=A0AAD7ACC9_9AGAR|nr:hypothetical protein DFH08DRAFT_1077351 [Mycena albidolilacea]
MPILLSTLVQSALTLVIVTIVLSVSHLPPLRVFASLSATITAHSAAFLPIGETELPLPSVQLLLVVEKTLYASGFTWRAAVHGSFWGQTIALCCIQHVRLEINLQFTLQILRRDVGLWG